MRVLHVQPSVIQSESQDLVSKPVVAPVNAPMPNLKPFIPYPSRRENEKRRDQANEQIEKFYEIFKEMSFEISFTDALILMPKFASTLKALIRNKEKLTLGYQALVHQASIPQPQVVTTTEFTNYMKANDAILKNMQTNMTSLTNSNLELKNMFGQFMKMNTASSSGSRTLPSNTVTNPKEDLKGIITHSGNAYQGPTIPTTSSSSQVVERETEVTKDTVPPTNNRSTKDIQPSVVQIETLIPNSEPVVAPIVEPVVAPVSAPKPNQKPPIPYPSRLHDQKLRDKTSDKK
nr:reverse transcriptase domain-containing protein [Tanacetum cinerariifolium]